MPETYRCDLRIDVIKEGRLIVRGVRCRQRVANAGDRCWRHKDSSPVSTRIR